MKWEKYIKLEVTKAQGDKAHFFSHADGLCVCLYVVFVFVIYVEGGVCVC